MGIGISEAVDLTGRVAELIKKGATLEAQEKIADLREAVLAGKDEVLHLRDENQQLRQRIREQDDWDSRVSRYKLTQVDGGAIVFLFEGDPAHHACPACFEARKLHILQDENSHLGRFTCPGCKTQFNIHRASQLGSGRAITDWDPYST